MPQARRPARTHALRGASGQASRACRPRRVSISAECIRCFISVIPRPRSSLRLGPRARCRWSSTTARTRSRSASIVQLDRPVRVAVGMLDRVVARLADREHEVGRSRRVDLLAAPATPAAGAGARAALGARPAPRPRNRRVVASIVSSSSATSSSGAPIASLTFRDDAVRVDEPHSDATTSAEQVDALVDVLAAPFDQAVGVHREHGVLGERDRASTMSPGSATPIGGALAWSSRIDRAGVGGRRAAAADARRRSRSARRCTGSKLTQVSVIISSPLTCRSMRRTISAGET